jgi:hypothetical protein
MKINELISKSIILYILILSNVSQIYFSKVIIDRSRNKNLYQIKSETNKKSSLRIKTSNRFRTQFNSRTSNNQSLKAFNIRGSSHLIAKCPNKSVLIKLIFEKRNDYIIDVGFNCRRDKNIPHQQIKLERTVNSNSFDEITPPNIECPSDHALSGLEIEKANTITYFNFYCNKIPNMEKKLAIVNNKFYPNEESVSNPMERKLFSRFLPHTDIFLSKENIFNGLITSISFTRDQGSYLSYSYTTTAIKPVVIENILPPTINNKIRQKI